MKLVTIALIAAALAAFAPLARAQAPDSVMINFDVDTSGSAIAHGTQVNETWAGWGIHFRQVPGPDGFTCGGDEVYAVSECLFNGPISLPNMISPCEGSGCPDFSENSFGSIQVDLDREAVRVCIGVVPPHASDRGRLRAFNQVGDMINEVQSPPGETPSIICIAQPGIRRVEFTAPGTLFARFDDLQVEFVPVPVQPITFGAVKAMFR